MVERPVGRRVLIADPSPALRSWVAAGIGAASRNITEVAWAWEVFWHLAEGSYDLVVVGSGLDVAPEPLLAMVRTTGLETAFLLVMPYSSSSAMARVERMAPVEVVDDWSDGTALRAASERLCGMLAPAVIELPRARLLRAAEVAVGRFFRSTVRGGR